MARASRKDGPLTEYADLIIKNENGEILLLQKKWDDGPMAGKWGFPGGHLEKGEEPMEGARREAKEETGYDFRGPLTQLSLPKFLPECIIYYYEAPNPIWMDLTLTEEHESFAWVKPDEIDTYDLIANLASYVNDILYYSTIHPAKQTEPSSAGGDIIDLEHHWQILSNAFDQGLISEEQFFKAREKYLSLRVDNAAETVSKAFDEGQITEEQYVPVIEKAKATYAVGTIRKFGGRDHIKGADGKWRYHSKKESKRVKEDERTVVKHNDNEYHLHVNGKKVGHVEVEGDDDGKEMTITGAEIDPEHRGKGHYKHLIFGLAHQNPGVKIHSVFRSDEAERSWSSFLKKLPKDIKHEKKHYKDEDTTDHMLTHNPK